MPVPFNEIKFGYSSAEMEGASEPELLLKGYFQQEKIIGEARVGSKFLFLGYKGAGKSAINEHLRLSALDDPMLFVKSVFLADFPYADFKNIVNGENETKYPTAWSWLLLLYLFTSFAEDEGAQSNQDREFLDASQILRSAGLLPSPSLRQIALISSKRSFKISIPTMFESAFEQSSSEHETLQIPFIVERLKSISSKFRSNSRHLLIIDGLDDILTKNQVQYDALSGLVLEVSRLNMMFQRMGVPAKILLLCRTDLYERLPGANKNKIRQDNAINLDWYHDPRNPRESNLFDLVNLRAKLTDPTINDILVTYFPRKTEGVEIGRYLLDMTRHTPRDFIQLFKYIQQFASPHKIMPDQVLSAVRSYSIHYFLPEIRDELVGYVNSNDIELIIELIGSLGKREFFLNELEDKAKEQKRFASLELSPIIFALYECSAIGNVRNVSGGTTHYTFKYRNRSSTLNQNDRFTLHKGMWKALNLV